MSDQIINTTDAGFDTDVLASGLPVLVDFWAEWCGPCKAIAPALVEVAAEFDGRVCIAKLNIDENPATPPRFGIRSIPTLILFKDGAIEAQKIGALSKAEIEKFLTETLFSANQ